MDSNSTVDKSSMATAPDSLSVLREALEAVERMIGWHGDGPLSHDLFYCEHCKAAPAEDSNNINHFHDCVVLMVRRALATPSPTEGASPLADARAKLVANAGAAGQLSALRAVLEFIAGGNTIPGYKGTHPDERVALLQEVMHGAQVKAKEGLAMLEALAVPQSESDWICSQPDCGLMHSEHGAAAAPKPALEQLTELRSLWMERAKKLRTDSAYTDCAVTLESCADELSSLFRLATPKPAPACEAPPLNIHVVKECLREAGEWVDGTFQSVDAEILLEAINRALAASVPPPTGGK